MRLLMGIDNSIPQNINTFLLSTFTADEVYVALKSMGPTKAPGPDGFSVLFFKKFWRIVSKDITTFCLGILNED